jgi:hypothetical protein
MTSGFCFFRKGIILLRWWLPSMLREMSLMGIGGFYTEDYTVVED